MNSTLSVAILSGKGGVGKTNIALNLAMSLHQNGYKTLLMDCDMGLANLDVLLGITPEGNIQDVILGKAKMEEVLHAIVPNGLDVLPAASGVPELNDLGAGISETVQTFAVMAALRVIIITPEPTSLTDSYALIKVLNKRFGLEEFMVVVNEVTSAKEAQRSFDKLAGACRFFLKLEPKLLGHVRQDKKLPEAVCRQQPLMTYAPGSPAAQDIQAIGAKLQATRLAKLDWLADRSVLQNLPKNDV